jgi:hypothetical protein
MLNAGSQLVGYDDAEVLERREHPVEILKQVVLAPSAEGLDEQRSSRTYFRDDSLVGVWRGDFDPEQSARPID